MPSQKSSKRIPLPLPWGFGSMAFKGRTWQLTWRDPAGKIHWESSGTADAAEAQRIMANRALPRAQAMVKALRAIIDGKPYQKSETAAGHGEARDRAEHGASGRSVRHHATVGANRKTTPRGGKP